MKYSGPMHQTAFISTKQSQRELGSCVQWSHARSKESGVHLTLVLKTKDRKEILGPD